MLNIELIESLIIANSKIGIEVKHDSLPDKELVIIRPIGFTKNRGIYLTSTLKWRTLITELQFEDYSNGVLDNIFANSTKIKIFKDLVNSIQAKNNRRIVTLEIDEAKKSIKYHIEQSPIDINKNSAENYLTFQCLDILNTILVFFELKEFRGSELEGFPEGAKIKVEVNRYERSSINRSLCINHFGPICQVCEFNFFEFYGILGEGFIHIHLIIPVSQLGPNYVINPIKDLVPLCPNCHAMVHRINPPIKPDELSEIIARNRIAN